MSNKRGFFLLEVNVALLVVFVMVVVFNQQILLMLMGIKRMEMDIELCLNERLIIGRLEDELMHETELLEIKNDAGGLTELSCHNRNGSRLRSFFCRKDSNRQVVLYQKTRNPGKPAGINPLTHKEIAVHLFRVSTLNLEAVQIVLVLETGRLSRRRETVAVVQLLNGAVYEGP